MLLTELVLHNFGVYRGRHHVALAPPSPDKPVVLIGGLNGAGKTTFLDALQLSFYGHRARTSNRAQTGYDEYLRRCINRSVPPEDGASLEIAFTVERDGASVRYRLRRQWSAQGARMREHVTVWRDDVVDELLGENWSDHIEELLPLEIASLFFFDGEKIEALADPERARLVIRSAVQSLLGIGVVDRLSTDLVALQRRQRPAEKDDELEKRIAALADQLEAARAARTEANDRLGQARVLLGQAQVAFERSEAAFAAGGGDLLDQQHALEAEHAAATLRVKQLEDDLRQEAAGVLPLALAANALARVDADARAEVAADAARRFERLLVERDETVLTAARSSKTFTPASLRLLSEMLEKDRASRATLRPSAASLRLTDEAHQGIAAALAALPEARRRAEAMLGLLVEAQERVLLLERKLAAVPASDSVSQLRADRQEARDRVLELSGRCAALEEEVGRLGRARAEAKVHWERAVTQQVERALKSEDVTRLVDHAERARHTLSAYREKLLARHIDKLQVAVLDSFRRLMRKQGLVCDLHIDKESFDLTLVDADGAQVRPERLSAGERQLLAVAILWGLARLAGHRLPTVVDTPLGRLDSTHRKHLVERYFPQAGRQVLLLSTDEEIDEDLQARLAPSVGHSYLIAYDDALQSSTLTPGYFWNGLDDAA